MGLLTKKRKDGKLVRGGDPMMHIMPYLMKGRNESAVYFSKTIYIDEIQEYIRKKRRNGERITVFNIVVASLCSICFTSAPG